MCRLQRALQIEPVAITKNKTTRFQGFKIYKLVFYLREKNLIQHTSGVAFGRDSL